MGVNVAGWLQLDIRPRQLLLYHSTDASSSSSAVAAAASVELQTQSVGESSASST